MKIKTKDLVLEPGNIEIKTVVKSGNGAVIPYTKKYIGKEVYVILKEKCRTE